MTIVYHYGHVSRSLNPYLLAGKYVEIMSCRAETLNIFRGKCTCCFLGLQLLVWYEVILFNVLTDIMCSWWSPCMLWMVLFFFFSPTTFNCLLTNNKLTSHNYSEKTILWGHSCWQSKSFTRFVWREHFVRVWGLLDRGRYTKWPYLGRVSVIKKKILNRSVESVCYIS